MAKSKKGKTSKGHTNNHPHTNRPVQQREEIKRNNNYANWNNSGRVPPLDAFDNIPKRTPPNLPGQNPIYEENIAPQPTSSAQKAKNKKRSNAAKKADKPSQKEVSKQQERRKNRKKKRQNSAKRRRNRRIAAVFFILLLIGVGIGYSVKVLFKIEKVIVESMTDAELPYTQEEFEMAFPAKQGDNLFGFSASNAARTVEETLPYVSYVTVRRRLPDTIILRVTPAQERYYMEWNGQFAVVSNTQKTLRFSEEEPAGLIRIIGLLGVEPVPGKMLAVSSDILAVQASQAKQFVPVQTPEEQSPPQEESTSESQPEEPAQEGEGEPAVEAAPEAAPEAEAEAVTPEETAQTAEEEPVPDEEPAPAPVVEPIPPDAALVNFTEEELLEEANSRVEALNLLISELEISGFEDISWLNVEEPLNLKFRWQNRITVVLGAPTGIDKKMQAVTVMLTDLEQSDITEGDRGILDVSFYLTTKEIRFQRE